MPVVIAGVVIAAIFAFLWARDVMTPEVTALVDARWAEYGIPLDASAGNGGIRQSSRPLRRLLRR